jgi:hypothetical protein
MDKLEQSAAADLEFMRSVVEESRIGHISSGIGVAMLVAGLAYSIQSLVIWAQINNFITQSEILSLGVTMVATSSFLLTLATVFIRKRTQLVENSLTGRAVSAIFAGFGLSVLGSAIVFTIITMRFGDIQIWQIFGAVFAALQSSVWAGTAIIKNTTWFRYIATGWFVVSIGLAVLFGSLHYLLLMAGALLLLMAIPGFLLCRRTQA